MPTAEEAAWLKWRDLCVREANDRELDAAGKELCMQEPSVRPLEMRACAESGWRFARRWLYLNNSGRIMPLHYTPAQWNLARLVAKIRKARLPVRVRILKARQEGISTFCESDGFHKCRFREYINAVVIAHRKDSATNLFGMFRLFYNKLPDWMRPALSHFARQDGLGFEDTHSQIDVFTAKDENIGRSGNPSWVHCSELAFWPGVPKDTVDSLYQGVHLKEGTTIFEESTANGVSGYFYHQWRTTQRAHDRGKDTLWHNLFIAWWEHPDYAMPVTEREAAGIMSHLDREEEFLVERFRVTPQQLRWRKYAISDKCGGDLEKFKQEYPSFAEEAFRSSGSPYFGTKVLVGWMRAMEPKDGEPETKGYRRHPLSVCVPREQGTDVPGMLDLAGLPVGNVELRHHEITLRIFQTPQPGVRYVLAADVAEGNTPIHRQGSRDDPDYCAACVGRVDTYDIVATLHGRWHPDIYAEALSQTGMLYNVAVLAVEAHSIGEAVITWIASPRIFKEGNELRVRPAYPNLYRRVVGKEARLGWQTGGLSRPKMLALSRSLIREGIGRIPDLHWLREHMAMENLPDGKVQVKEGHDDCVLARAILVSVIQQIQPTLQADEFIDEPATIEGKVHEYERRLYEMAQWDYEPDPYAEVYE